MKEGWERNTIGDIAIFQSGSRPKGGVGTIKEGVLSLGGEHIGKDGYVSITNPKYVTFDYYTNNPKGHIEENDILLCKDGALTGKVAIVRKELKGDKAMINEHVFIIRTKLLLQKYLFFFLFSPNGQIQLKTRISGAAQGGLNGANLKTIAVPYPIDKNEQQQIVEELDLLSSIIEKKKEQLKELDNLAQSIFYDMFGDPVTNEKGWKISPFKNIATFKNGLNYHPTDNGTIIKCIGVGDFQNRKELRDFSILKDLSIDETIDEDYYLKDGDILIVRSNGSRELVGRNMIVYPNNQKITYSGFCIRCRISIPDILPIILNRILSSRSTMIILRQEGRGCNISNINQKILSSLPVILPPLPLQQQFASKIEAIEQQKELIKQSITEVETLFNSRMDYYFN